MTFYGLDEVPTDIKNAYILQNIMANLMRDVF